MKKSSLLLAVLTFCIFFISYSQTTKPTKAYRGGRVLGSFFSEGRFYLSEPTSTNPAVATGGRNEFEITRARVGYEYAFNRNLSTRIMYEASGNYLREGFVKWDNLFPQHSLTFGLMKTEATKLTEKLWGYRSLDKMMLDRIGFLQTYDKGVELSGKMDAMYYNVMVGNGAGSGPETNKLKKIYTSFGMWLDKSSVVDVYVDFENVVPNKSSLTTKLFYGMNSRTMAFGFEGFYRIDKNFAVEKVKRNRTPLGASIFSWMELMPETRGVVRVDFLDQDFSNATPKVKGLTPASATYREPSYRQLYLNVGIDFTPIPEVHFIPNIVYVKNLQKGDSPVIKDTQLFRLTAAVYFPTMP